MYGQSYKLTWTCCIKDKAFCMDLHHMGLWSFPVYLATSPHFGSMFCDHRMCKTNNPHFFGDFLFSESMIQWVMSFFPLKHLHPMTSLWCSSEMLSQKLWSHGCVRVSFQVWFQSCAAETVELLLFSYKQFQKRVPASLRLKTVMAFSNFRWICSCRRIRWAGSELRSVPDLRRPIQSH